MTSAHVFYLCILALVVVAVSMSYENRERFESVAMSSGSGSAISAIASPALANLLATPVLSAPGPNLQVDVLQRGKDEQVKSPEAKAPDAPKAPPQASCPGPDMTQYIRIKDIPCWNCNVSETIH